LAATIRGASIQPFASAPATPFRCVFVGVRRATRSRGVRNPVKNCGIRVAAPGNW